MRNEVGVIALLGMVGWSAAFADGVVAPAEDVAKIASAAEEAEVVILGEMHDNPTHHAIQAAVVARLQPAALVFEMIPQAREAEVNDLREQNASRAAIEEALDWADSGWPSFDYYADILDAAPQARVFGAGQPQEDVRRASVEGAAAAFGPDATAYALDVPLAPDDLAAREADMAASHCGKLPAEMLPGMVEAQRFRDAGLADAALWARTMTGGGRVVVIAGTGHADRTRGIPAALAAADPTLAVFSVGQVETGSDNRGSFDLVVSSPPAERPDPCAVFDKPKG